MIKAEMMAAFLMRLDRIIENESLLCLYVNSDAL